LRGEKLDMNANAKGRKGALVDPIIRLSESQVELIHETSLEILEKVGVLCFNREAVGILKDAGCMAEERTDGSANVQFPPDLVEECLELAPSDVLLGARDAENVLVLRADEPRVRFGSGSEANIYLEMEPGKSLGKDENAGIGYPVYRRLKGNVELLCRSAHLCQQLENLDFFIRTVNIQDPDISEADKDVNKFFASLNNTTKHVMAGLTSIESLDDVIRMGEIIAGGERELRENPVLSFITCVTKSPLQFVKDTTQKMIEVVRKGMPVAISSSPQGGSTAPIQEAGMVSQINAEIISGITLSQIVKPGAPVLYGSVPVRARMDDLNDLYGAPEFCWYNVDCIQMARRYGIPCYSTAGVGDAKVPGVQATVEKMLTHTVIPMAGAQYVHYAFGLMEKTNVFSPDQAILDDAQIGIVKHMLRSPDVDKDAVESSVAMIGEVMRTSHKLYARHVRKGIRDGTIFQGYPFETKEEADLAVIKAHEKYLELIAVPPCHMEMELARKIFADIDGIVDRLNPYA